MKKQGYMIAQNGNATAFFTSSSSYDRPKWISVKEATIYPSAELADKALLKLLKNGAYSAKLVEASSMQFDFPDTGPNRNQPPVTQTDDNIGDEDNLGDNEEMTTGQLSDDPEEDLNLDDEDFDEDNDEDEFGQDEQSLGPDDEFRDMEDNEQAISPIELSLMKGRRSRMPNGNGPMRESSTIPNKPSLDAVPSENKTTAVDIKKPEKVKFTQDNRNDIDTNFSQDIEPLYKNAKVPANVMRAIKSSIELYDRAADFNNGRDDSEASLALTIADSLRTIQDCLTLNTEEGIKQAQIKITTFMNPITTNFPPEVIDFLYKHGRQPLSLKNIFYDKWDSKPKEY